MKVWKLRQALNDAEELNEIFLVSSGSYSIGEREANMIRNVCRFLLTFDTMDAQLTERKDIRRYTLGEWMEMRGNTK